MNVVPPSNFSDTASPCLFSNDESNAVPGLPDTFRGQVAARPMNSQLNDRHPLQSRIQNWNSNQRNLQLQTYKQIFGLAEPVRLVMEEKILAQTHFNFLSQGSIHHDILMNRECSLDWEDIYQQSEDLELSFSNNVHSKIERSLGL